MNAERLLDRFLRYVRIDTTANDETEAYPSSPGQLTLGAILAEELRTLGAAEVLHDEHGIVWATLPGNTPHSAPTIAFNAHIDTSPETTGANVKPQVIRDYRGGDITLPADLSKVIRVSENPELETLLGKTLVTTDGTTLLGSDDKSGVAVIMETAAFLQEHPEIQHGPIRIVFTCDEEIGRGVKHADPAQIRAVACYTLDGSGAGEIDVETFSADQVIVNVTGVNIHPSIAKGRMVNAVRALSSLIAKLPLDRAPETTEGRVGFLHPYGIEGSVAHASAKILLRSFDTAELTEQADVIRRAASETEREFPGSRIEVTVRKQYRNMAEGVAREPRSTALAEQAFANLGRPCKRTIVRGGTDGSQFTERGLPTPNLSTGEHNPHSPLEWTCLEEMVQACEMLVELAKLWGRERAA